MNQEAIDRDVAGMLAMAREHGRSLDEGTAREKVIDLHAQADEHGVPVEAIRNRNLLRELFGGGAKP